MNTRPHHSLPIPHRWLATMQLNRPTHKFRTALTCALVVMVIVLAGYTPAPAGSDATTLRETLTDGNHFAIMRHAIAPGTGDPDNFVIGDCKTQRNLSDRGRRQAETIGQRLRDAGIVTASLYSSQWCRCLETAELLELGTARELVLLNSFFQDFGKREAQTEGLLQWLAKQDLVTPLVLVTHQVNITALTGVYPSSGELIIVKREPDNTLSVVGRIETE